MNPFIKTLSNHLKKNDYFFLYFYILLIITSIIIFYKIQVQLTIGPMWDAFDFLANAKYFAGQGFGHIDPARPPFLSFLTSILFRLGFTTEISIFIADGLLFIFGVMGLFLFLNLRFKPILGFIGSLFFCSFPVILLWAGAGYTDVASTSLSIWALYFTVLAVKKNSKFYYLTFPMFTLAFLTRFPSAIIIFPMAIYILINNSLRENIKEITLGILISFILMIPEFIFLLKIYDNPILPILGVYSATESQGIGTRFAYNLDFFYYLKNFIYSLINMDFLNNSSLIVQIIFFVLTIFLCYIIILGFYIIFRKFFISHKENLTLKKIKNIKIFVIFLFIFFFVISFNRVSYLISITLFSIIFYLIFNLVRNENLKFLDLDILFFIWLSSYLIFNSIFSVKVFRYYIPMTPAISYFIIIGVKSFLDENKLKIKKIKLNKVLSGLIIIFLLFSTFSYIYQLEYDPLANGKSFKLQNNGTKLTFFIDVKPYVSELYFETYNTHKSYKKLSNWLKGYDPDYKEKIIYADYFWPHLRWYLKTDIGSISPNKNSNKDIENLLNQFNADYFISIRTNIELKEYIVIKEFNTNFGTIRVFKKIY
ncbi:MAG: hypothetical protein Kow0019_07880 [Methanobacteriaceae archaeon]